MNTRENPLKVGDRVFVCDSFGNVLSNVLEWKKADEKTLKMRSTFHGGFLSYLYVEVVTADAHGIDCKKVSQDYDGTLYFHSTDYFNTEEEALRYCKAENGVLLKRIEETVKNEGYQFP